MGERDGFTPTCPLPLFPGSPQLPAGIHGPTGSPLAQQPGPAAPPAAASAPLANLIAGRRSCPPAPRRPGCPLLLPAGHLGAALGKGPVADLARETHQVGAHRALRQHQGALGHQEDLDVGEAGHLLFLLLVPLRFVPLQLAAPAAARRAARLLRLHPSPAAAAAAFPLALGVGAAAGRGCARRGCVLSPPRAHGGRPRPAGAGKVESTAPRSRRRARPPASSSPPPPPSLRLLLRLGLCQSQGLLSPPAAAAASPPADARRCHRPLAGARGPRLPSSPLLLTRGPGLDRRCARPPRRSAPPVRPGGRREDTGLGAQSADLQPRLGRARVARSTRERGSPCGVRERVLRLARRPCPAPRRRCGARGAAADTGWYCKGNSGRRGGVRRLPRGAGT